MNTRRCNTREGNQEGDSAQNGSMSSTNLAETNLTRQDKEPWLNLVFIFLIHVLTGINYVLYPMYYVEPVRYFRIPTAQVGWPSSIHQAVTLMFGIVLTAPVKRYGCRVIGMAGGVVVALGTGLSVFANSIAVLSLTYGLLGGIGVSMLTLASMVILQQSFHKNRSVATSIGMCGTNVGNVVGPMWANYLLETFGWRGGFLLQSGLMLHTIIFATQHTSLKSTPPESGKEEQGATICSIIKGALDFTLLKDCTFLVYGISVFLLGLSGDGITTVLANSVVFYGGTHQQAASIVTVLFSSFLVSRLICGFVAKLPCVSTVIMLGVSGIIGGCFLFLLITLRGFIATIIIISVFGASVGCSYTLAYVGLVDISGIDTIARSIAITLAFNGLAALFAPILSGLLFDLTGDYNATFLVNGGIGVFGGLLAVLVYFMKRRQPSILQKVSIDGEKYVSKTDEEPEI